MNQEAVYGTRGGPYLPTTRMVSTHKDYRIYLHLLKSSGKKLTLPLEKEIRIKAARFLVDGTPVKLKRNSDSYTLSLPGSLPDKTATVIVLELDKPASEIEPIKL